jgi:radical SAM protein with 4Fe4S-binding SPASM domain
MLKDKVPVIIKKVYHRVVNHKLDTVFIEPTNACNLRCRTCYQNRDVGFMSKSLFVKIVDALAEIKPKTVLLHYGGESLLHSDFKEFLLYARRKLPFSAIGWQSNGMLFDEEIAKSVVAIGVDSVGFSLEGLSETNDSIRCGANFATVANNIKKLIEIKGNSGKPYVKINITKSKQSWESVDEFIREWLPIVDGITVNPCLNEKSQIQNPEEYFRTPRPKRIFCYQPFSMMGILYNGDVVSCCSDINGRQILGNVNNQTIPEIWQSEGYQQLRRQCLWCRFSEGSPCAVCDSWKTESTYKFGKEM